MAQQQAANQVMQDAMVSDRPAAIANFKTVATCNPSLQSSELFINLQYEVAGTENRIATELMRYNQAVQTYNQSLQAFPSALVAKSMDFTSHPYFHHNPN